MSVTVRMLRDYLFYLSILSLVFVPVATATASSEVNLETDRWWVGYYYLGPEKAGEQIADLVSGYIECVPITPPVINAFGVEWISIVTQYFPKPYWVQCGYGIYRISEQEAVIFFYAERMDKKTAPKGVRNFSEVAPVLGYTYKYIVCRIYRSNDYHIVIQKEGVEQVWDYKFYDLDPYIPIDYVASVETNHYGTDIYVSHFYDLRYRTSGRRAYSRNWGAHEPKIETNRWDIGYWFCLDEGQLGDVPDDPTIHYQFYAWNTLYR